MTRRQLAVTLILVVDIGMILWGASAVIAPDGLLGPGGKAILPAGFEGYSGGSWSVPLDSNPQSAAYMTVLFRLYAMFCVLFGFMGSAIALTAFRRGERWAWWTLLVANTVGLLSAMTYDKLVHAIGPFEVTEYFGLLFVCVSFAMTARTRPSSSPIAAMN